MMGGSSPFSEQTGVKKEYSPGDYRVTMPAEQQFGRRRSTQRVAQRVGGEAEVGRHHLKPNKYGFKQAGRYRHPLPKNDPTRRRDVPEDQPPLMLEQGAPNCIYEAINKPCYDQGTRKLLH